MADRRVVSVLVSVCVLNPPWQPPPEAGAAATAAQEPGEEDLGPPAERLDFYISYRELDSNGHSDKDIASRLAGALQKATGADGERVSVFAPDGEKWETRLTYGLRPAQNILLIVSQDGLRRIQEAHRAEDVMLLEIEYALAEKLKGNKKVMLLLAKDKGGSNFSHFTTDVFPGGDIAKIAQPPCHKSKLSAKLWDNGAKGDLLFKDRKPGEHSIRETMDELFRLNARNISQSSKDVKLVVPEIIAMLQVRRSRASPLLSPSPPHRRSQASLRVPQIAGATRADEGGEGSWSCPRCRRSVRPWRPTSRWLLTTRSSSKFSGTRGA
jgi:hypothetical protein